MTPTLSYDPRIAPWRRCIVGGLAGLLLLSSGALIGRGQNASSEADPVLRRLEGRVNQFVEGVSVSVSRDELHAAYVELLAGSELLSQTETLQQLEAQTEQLAAKYGAYRGAELIDAEHIGRDVTLLKVLYKCDKFPVVWYFVFYRVERPGEPGLAEDDWVIVSLRFDTELELLAL